MPPCPFVLPILVLTLLADKAAYRMPIAFQAINYNLLIIKDNLALDRLGKRSTHCKGIILSLKGTKIVGEKGESTVGSKKIPLAARHSKGGYFCSHKILKSNFCS